jgi:hypothetical protein
VSNRWSFLGFGIEVETFASDMFATSTNNSGTTTGDDIQGSTEKYQERTYLDGIKTPPTKIQVNIPKKQQ